jgi:steroid delta-isomerase-like uncharacterized protein
MAAEENKALTRRFYDQIANNGNLDLIDELIAEDFVDHEEFPGLPANREGLKQFFSMMRNAFDGFRMDVEDVIAEGDKVVARVTMKGTHKGKFMGIAGTGKTVKVDTIDIIRIVDGKAVEHWGVTDGMSMMEQIGAH